eukprot:gene31799-6999_t
MASEIVSRVTYARVGSEPQLRPAVTSGYVQDELFTSSYVQEQVGASCHPAPMPSYKRYCSTGGDPFRSAPHPCPPVAPDQPSASHTDGPTKNSFAHSYPTAWAHPCRGRPLLSIPSSDFQAGWQSSFPSATPSSSFSSSSPSSKNVGTQKEACFVPGVSHPAASTCSDFKAEPIQQRGSSCNSRADRCNNGSSSGAWNQFNDCPMEDISQACGKHVHGSELEFNNNNNMHGSNASPSGYSRGAEAGLGFHQPKRRCCVGIPAAASAISSGELNNRLLKRRLGSAGDAPSRNKRARHGLIASLLDEEDGHDVESVSTNPTVLL